jgi:hypothetical protein
MTLMAADSADRLIAKLVELGLRENGLAPVVETLCVGLRDAGVGLVRAQAAMPARHPLFDADGLTWRHGAGIVLRRFAHGGRDQEPFRSSPFAHMMATGNLTNLPMSDAFAARCGRPVRSLGRHAMRGLAAPQELFALR